VTARTGESDVPAIRRQRERRIRLAYLDGAETWSREAVGRGLTEGELEGVVRRFR
jgi:hypothetical protein